MQPASILLHSTRTRLTPRFNGWISPAPAAPQGRGGASRPSPLRGALLGCLGLATAVGALLAGTGGLQNAIANGDTRTLSFYHAHTRETLTVTFRRNGRYERGELQKLNWFLRDWRNDETVSMDPKLFDIVWAAQREAGSSGTVRVLSAYRSPGTNAMLRRRSSAVAKNSQHTQGRALDFSLPDADMAKVRAIGMRLQRGGVGYYPNVPFVHLDSGSVRSWPRMPRNQLERLFPDGRTVHLPADGRPLDGYETAKQTILARGDSVPGFSASAAVAAQQPERRRSFWATLFGGADEAEDAEVADTSASRRQIVARNNSSAAAPPGEDDNDPRRFFLIESRNAAASGRQVAAPARAPAPAPAPAPVPVVAPAPAPVPQAPVVPVGSPVQILPNFPREPVPASVPAFAPQVADRVFDGPVPVARPVPPAQVPVPTLVPPAQPGALPALIAALPPPRPGAPAPAPTVMAAATLPAIPAPPARPPELKPVLAGDRDALAAIAAASGTTVDGPADRSIQTAALAYAPAPAVIPPPLPPARPQAVVASASAPAPAAAPSVRVSPSLPPAAGGDERRALTQLFATVATDAKPSPRAQVRTAKVVTAAPAPRTPAPVTATPPKVVVQMEFTRDTNVTDLSTTSFSGPAVKPLPVARFGQ